MENLQSKQAQKLDAQLKQAETIVQMLMKRGVLPDMAITDEARRTVQQKKQKESFHNTLLLLKNYRSIAWMLECFPEAVAEELERPFEDVDKLLDGVTIAATFRARRIEQRLVSLEQTRLLLDRINDALTVLKRKPENGQLLYDLIYLTYISEQKLPLQEVLYRVDVSPRHFYRLREQAVNLLSLRLWGTPNASTNLLAELLALEEQQKRNEAEEKKGENEMA